MAPDRGSTDSAQGDGSIRPQAQPVGRHGDQSESRRIDRYRSDASVSSNGSVTTEDENEGPRDALLSSTISRQNSRALIKTRSDLGCYSRDIGPPDPATDATNFTLRGTLVGLAIGIIICFSNTYFGLQTGWVSGMAMPASLIGFGFFKTLSKHLKLPFTPVENVLVQTVAGAVGTMPLGCGFVGVIPALEFLLKKDEGAPIELGIGRLTVWSLGICLFGLVFAMPLRKEVIIREKLKFPSGTATALMIGVLHGGVRDDPSKEVEAGTAEETQGLLQENQSRSEDDTRLIQGHEPDKSNAAEWKSQIRRLFIAFLFSASYTLFQYFVPQVRDIPVLGVSLASTWLWSFNPSPAYIGQGIIMGPATTLHMLLGAIIGWGVLSPVAKKRGYAPGDTSSWEDGSKGWIVWVSLAIMLADAVINLCWLIVKSVVLFVPKLRQRWTKEPPPVLSRRDSSVDDKTFDVPDDAPPDQLISTRTIAILLPLSLIFCIFCIQIAFGKYITVPLTLLATVLALLLSIMGVRALGETDLNPVSGISKLTQLVFAVAIPSSSPGHQNNAIIVNLLAGAVSESGALQAGDMLQDLKAGHLIGASPKAQFYGLAIGSVVGAVASACVYKLYVHVYDIPGGPFQVPTAYVWIFTARLVTGQGLPPMASQYAFGAGIVFIFLTSLRIYFSELDENNPLRRWHPYVPGGIAVAVGMYNTPSFTLARTVGGLINWWWIRRGQGEGETKVIVLASGLILGEGVISILNLVLAAFDVPHL